MRKARVLVSGIIAGVAEILGRPLCRPVFFGVMFLPTDLQSQPL